jgi:predicted ATP-binding protein involved in virulence
MDKRITIIHGPNGFGKTAMLRLLNGFFNSRYSVFRTIPFSQFQINFNNGDRVEISKNPETPENQKKREQISFDFYEMGQEKT